MRPADDQIPGDEDLYRTLSAEWVDGNRVLHSAIDGEGTSCFRSEHITPEKAIAARPPEENGLASVLPRELPVDFLSQTNRIRYDTFAVDAPKEGNEAHCEIRWRRVEDRPSLEHFKGIKSSAAKTELKTAIADRMQIRIPPRRLPAGG